MSGPAHGSRDSQPRNGGPAWDSALLADLRATGEDLADIIETRKAAENRRRTLGHADAELICPPWVAEAETLARARLREAYVLAVPAPIREWAARQPCLGSGELFPRLIAITGDPCLATPLLPIAKGDTGRGARSRPAGPPYHRSMHQFRQWTGIGDPDWRRDNPSQGDVLRAGKRRQVRPLLFVWTTQLIKSQRFASVSESAYWKLFSERLVLTRGHDGPCAGDKSCHGSHRKHERECRNHQRPPARSDGCGVAQHPEWGAPGSPWRPGHVNMDAHRVVAQALADDLWRTARQLHGGCPNPGTAARRERRDRAR